MIPDDFLDQIATRLNNVLPADVAPNIKKNIRALLESAFDRLDLVTREEFDAQKAVLQRTREKVDFLQHEISRLEQKDS